MFNRVLRLKQGVDRCMEQMKSKGVEKHYHPQESSNFKMITDEEFEKMENDFKDGLKESYHYDWLGRRISRKNIPQKEQGVPYIFNNINFSSK